MPPGHAKREYGSKSAKKHAHGQKKKVKKQNDKGKRDKKGKGYR